MNIVARAGNDNVDLVFVGQGLVQDAEAVAAELKGFLSGKEPAVTLDLSGVTAADVTFFQLLQSFQLSLTAAGRRLEVSPLPPGHPVAKTAELLGIRYGTSSREAAG